MKLSEVAERLLAQTLQALPGLAQFVQHGAEPGSFRIEVPSSEDPSVRAYAPQWAIRAIWAMPLSSPSAPSRLNFRVEPLQFHPCFVDGELPIDGSLLLVDPD